MIVLDPVFSASAERFELLDDYPLLSVDLIERMRMRGVSPSLRLRVLSAPGGLALRLSRCLAEEQARIQMAADLGERMARFVCERARCDSAENLLGPGGAAACRPILDRYNSRLLSALPERLPSLLAKNEVSAVESILGPRCGKIPFPRDRPMALHLVIDASAGLAGPTERAALDAVSFFMEHVVRVFKNTSVRIYAFSDLCRRLEYPVSETAVMPGRAHGASALRSLLFHRVRGLPNQVILFSRGEIDDWKECEHLAPALRFRGMDFTHISPAGSSERDARCPSLAELLHGNQIVLSEPSAAGAAAVHAYDRYQGMLAQAAS